MQPKLILILIFFSIFLLCLIPYSIAKKLMLKCNACSSRTVRKTGNKRKLERSRMAAVAFVIPIEYEYECLSCRNKFWTTIESICKT